MLPYKLLDCGEGLKLEQVGPHKIIRPAPQALWAQGDPTLWEEVDSEFSRSAGEKGRWRSRNGMSGSGLPPQWEIENDSKVMFNITPNEYGNIGMFAEHWSYVPWMLERFDPKEQILNLFSYAGSSCMELATKGFKLANVDSSRASMTLLNANYALNNVDKIGHKLYLEDCTKFMQREIRRGHKYASIIMDAPSFGRGTKGEIFNIEDHFTGLLNLLKQLLKPEGVAVITNHTPRFTPLSLQMLVESIFPGKTVEAKEIMQKAASGRQLPSGFLVTII
jgi:23S rRNA (cytosine1962-C5)-methyltransferase